MKRKADEGVKISILLYRLRYSLYSYFFRELPNTFPLNSLGNKEFFEDLSENIIVVCHPRTIETVMYTHHQKFVVIDQKFAFVGGIDLCFNTIK